MRYNCVLALVPLWPQPVSHWLQSNGAGGVPGLVCLLNSMYDSYIVTVLISFIWLLMCNVSLSCCK